MTQLDGSFGELQGLKAERRLRVAQADVKKSHFTATERWAANRVVTVTAQFTPTNMLKVMQTLISALDSADRRWPRPGSESSSFMDAA